MEENNTGNVKYSFLSLLVWCDVCSLVYIERVNADVFWCVRNGLNSSMKFQQNSNSIFFGTDNADILHYQFDRHL